jgi:predicted permease
MLVKSPGLAVVLVLTLAIGIGATTGIYNLAQAMLVRPVPGVRQPEHLVQIGRTRQGEGFSTVSYADFTEFCAQARTLELAAIYDTPFHLGSGTTAERVRGAVVSGNYFELLGVRVAAGRTFLPQEDTSPGKYPVAVIGFGLWQRRFGGDADIIGRTVTLNSYPFTVVGVADPRFKGTERRREIDVWVPMAMLAQAAPDFGTRPDLFSSHGVAWHDAIGRLKPGVSLAQARTELEMIANRLQQAFPDSNEDRGVAVAPGTSVHQRDRRETGQVLTLLLAVAGLALLGACANVANTQLARGAARRREIGVRLALGASGGRLVRQLLTENLLLALAAGSAGMVFAVWLSRLIVLLAPQTMGLTSLQLRPDTRVFAFAAGITLLAALVSGLAPSWRLACRDITCLLRDSSAQTGLSRSPMRNAIVVTQVALSLLLLVGAGLFLRTLQHVLNLRTELAVRSVLAATVDLGPQSYDPERGLQFYAALHERLRRLPGVKAASSATVRPFSDMGVLSPGRPEGAGEGDDVPLRSVTVTPGFFQTLGIPLLDGRDFEAADRPGAPAVAIVDESTAKRFWPDGRALGKRVVMGGRFGTQPFEVVGIVRDTPLGSPLQPAERLIYLPHAQHYQAQMALYVRAAGNPALLINDVRATLASLESNLPPFAVRTLAEELGQSLWPQRAKTTLLSVLAALALILAAVGLHGVIAWSVAQRTHEFGVRIALGAKSMDILQLVLRQGVRLILLGIAIGLATGLLLTPLARSQLIGVSPADPLTFVLTTLLLGAGGLASCWLPARRAARIDPMAALRCE